MKIRGLGSGRSWAIAVAVALVLGLLTVWLLWERCGLGGCPDVAELRGYVPDEASVVVDRDGRELAKLFRTRRTIVRLDSLPEHVGEAFVAIEDQDFWQHGGVDWGRMVGAVWSTARAVVGAGGQVEGGSTITMQLARNVFPEKLPADEKTLGRKIAEMRVAREIESQYTKEEILELYLNQIYFGSGAWGIEAAAQEYFGKPATDLTLSEAALLAALPVAPSDLNPRVNLEGARQRRDLVLERMAQQGRITRAEADEATAAEIRLARGETEGVENAPYFVEAVRQRLEAELGERIYTEGYTVHTTLDANAQSVLEGELHRQIDDIRAGRYGYVDGADALQGAAVLLDARTGDVVALVGGRDFSRSKFNRATQAERQPGSAFKPFVYATALERGYPLTFPLEDTPIRRVLDTGETWSPRNYGGDYDGQLAMREALVRSKNVATVRLAEQVGLASVVETAERMGVADDLPVYPAVALGAAEVRVIDLAAAYAAFATLGDRPEPRFITKVVDRNGTVIWSEAPETEQVIDPATAFLVTDVLQDVVDRGTATAVRQAGYYGPAAGKTGTTNDATDVWFVGYTPERVAAVWIGFDEPRRIVAGATGGGLAAPVWGRAMQRIGGGGGGWSPPVGVERRLVDETGAVVGRGCPAMGEPREEWFLAGTVPEADCFGPNVYTWPDSLIEEEGLRREREEDDGFWNRLRRRFFGDEEETPDTIRPAPGLPRDTTPLPSPAIEGEPEPDTMGLGAPEPDTMRPLPDTAAPAPPEPVAEPDTTEILGEPVD